MSSYDDYLNSLEQQDGKKKQLISSLSSAATVNPDDFANQVRLSKAASVSLDVLPHFKEEAQQAKLFGEVGLDRLWRDAPKTSDFLAIPNNAKLASDDTENLSGIEQITRSFKRGLTSGLRGQDASSIEESVQILNAIDKIERGGMIDPSNPYASMFVGSGSSSENIKRMKSSAQANLAENAVEFKQRSDKLKGLEAGGPLAKFYQSKGWVDSISALASNPIEIGLNIVAESTGTMAPTIPLIAASGLSGGARAMAATAGGTSASTEYATAIAEEIQKAGVDVTDAAAVREFVASPEFSEIKKRSQIKAAVVGAFDAATAGMAGVRVRPSAAGNLAAQTGIQAAGGAAGEAAGSVASGQEVNASAVLAEAFGEIPGAVTDVATMSAKRIMGKQQDAQQTSKMGDMLNDMNKLAESSKLRGRDTETAQAFFQSVMDEGRDAVFITPEALAQSGLAEKMAQSIPAVAEQLQTAAESGHDIRIPLADLMASMAGPELEQSIIPHVAIEPGGFTQTTAQEYLQSDHATELQAEVERVLAEKEGNDTFKQSAETVRSNIKEQLNTDGRFTEPVNDAYSTMVGNFFAAQAARMGMTPEAMFAKYPMQIGAQAVADGKEFTQNSGMADKDTVAGTQAPTSAGDGTTGSAITPDKTISANKIKPINGIEDKRKFDLLVSRMQSGGWQGRPVLAYIKNGKTLALTGSHRIAAARKVGVDVPIVIVPDSTVNFDDESGAFTSFQDAIDDQRLDSFFKAAGDAKSYALQNAEDRDYSWHKYPSDQIPVVEVEGSAKWAYDAYKSGVVPEGWYVHGRQGRQDLETGGVLQLTQDWDVANQFSGQPGSSKWLIRAKDGANTLDLSGSGTADMDKVVDAALKDFERNRLPWIDDLESSIGRDAEASDVESAVRDLFAPEDIVDSAKAYDSQVMSEWLADVFDYPSFVETPDGAVVFSREGIEAVKVPNEPSASAGSDVLNQQARGSFNPATLQITLLKNADLSTFLHESGHFFLEVQTDLAGKVMEEARIHGSDTLSPGEQQVLKDMQATLEWFGVKDLAEWSALDFEEKRSYHEKFARGFEAYLFEGKAPSIELQGVFQRFRAWMMNVYKELKALNVELSDEVRGVFDRMLATNEQIALAEQGRSMMPIFSSPDQIGMTPAEFADYQALGVDATNEAIEDLQARGLRDMQWINNARGRIIKQLQRESKERRAEVEMEIRREVMAQPLYRAWTFLTAKQSRDDLTDIEKMRADYREILKAWEDGRKAAETEARKDAKQEVWAGSEEGGKKYRKDGALAKAQQKVLKREEKAIEAIVEKTMIEWENRNRKPNDPEYRAKSDPNIVDETIDPLFAAIAKLGGINKAELVSTWGIDPADKAASGVFGKHVMRAEDKGLSIDGMAEALSQYGYLTLDEHGKWDIRELEEKFKAELGGDTQYSNAFDYSADQQNQDAPISNPGGMTAGRLSVAALSEIGLPAEVINTLKARKMTSKEGLHPDLVAELFEFSSGDELVRRLAAAEMPKDEIAALTDTRMLERFGDLSSPEAIQKAADKAIHNDVRARMIATEMNALAKAAGERKTLASAAKEYAAAMIARLKVRDIRPGQYASAEARAAKTAMAASKSGDLAKAAAEKRNELINNYATRAAYDTQEEIERAVRYVKKFENASTRNGLDTDCTDQIDTLLERFDLRQVSNRQIDRLTSMRTWVQSQLNAGEIPQIAESLLTKPERAAYIAQIESRGPDGELVYADDEERIKLLADAIDRSEKRSYKTLTVEEFRGLVDTVKQIEHLGRLKHQILTARDAAAYEVVRDNIAGSIAAEASANGKNTRTANDWLGQKLQAIKQFGAAHIKVATWARIMDGGKDDGPVWRYLVQPANERASQETTMRAEATAKLDAIMRPILSKVPAADKRGKGKWFPSINDSLNWQERFAIALNLGNESNTQRLLDGKGWTMAQIKPVLDTLTAEEWRAAQAVWDHFEEYRPLIASKELRVSGKEPEWIPARQITVQTADGQNITLRGGYYPVVYDARVNLKASQHSSSEEAKNLLKASYSAATTRRSFTKSRVEEVSGRPLLLNMQGLYSGVNDVIHDLAWHEWVMDANKLLRSKTIDTAIREHYGPEVKREFEKWRDDIVAGNRRLDHAIEKAAGLARQSVSASALTFNILSAAMQPLGLANSIARVGAPWIGKGVARYVAAPREATREAQAKSEWLANRTRTRFRELNELRNQVQGQTAARELMGRYGYWMMMKAQMMVDVPTWWGAYEKAIANGHDEITSINLADQSVKDSQGGGEEVDQSGVERGGPLVKLFTAFYGFMGTTLNTSYLTAKTESSKAKAAVNMVMVLGVPAIVGSLLKDALVPGDAGDEDEQGKKLLVEQLSFLAGLVAFGREFAPIIKTVAGEAKGQSYSGPAGLRIIPDSIKLAQQAGQGEFDEAFRKAFVNVLGDLTGVPSVQINRTITGAEALANGDTENPAALAFGFQRPH